jgi:hypothetical protein
MISEACPRGKEFLVSHYSQLSEDTIIFVMSSAIINASGNIVEIESDFAIRYQLVTL